MGFGNRDESLIDRNLDFKDLSSVERYINNIYVKKDSLSTIEYIDYILDLSSEFRKRGMINFLHDLLIDVEAMDLSSLGMDKTYNLKNIIGTMYFYQSSYDMSLKYYLEAIEYSNVKDSSKRGSIYNNIAEIYREVHEYDNALMYYSWAKDAFLTDNLEFHQGVVNINIGIVLIEEENYETALYYIEGAIDMLKSKKYRMYYGEAVGIKARILFLMGIVDLAIKYYDEAFNILHDIGNGYYLLKLLVHQGDFYVDAVDEDRGMEYYFQGLEIAKRFNNSKHASMLEERISKVYENRNDYRSALYHYKEFYYHKNIFMDQNLKARMSKLNQEYGERNGVDISSTHIENQILKEKSLELRNINVTLVNEIAIREKSQMKLIEKNERLMKISMLDELTQIPNRRYFTSKIEEILKYKEKMPIAIVMVDIDFFKKYNDLYGHVMGDQALVNVSKTLREVSEENKGFVVRYGGEEFVLVFENINKKIMNGILKRIQLKIKNLKIIHEKGVGSGYLTVSQGCNIVKSKNVSVKDMIEDADKALYLAKGQGRDMYIIK